MIFHTRMRLFRWIKRKDVPLTGERQLYVVGHEGGVQILSRDLLIIATLTPRQARGVAYQLQSMAHNIEVVQKQTAARQDSKF